MSVEIKLPPEELAQLRLPAQQRDIGFGSRRMYLGGLLLILSTVVLLRSFVFQAGYDSTLVADLGVVRAPLSGVVGQLSADVGDRVRRDQPLGYFAVPVGLTAAVTAGSADVGQLTSALGSIDTRIAMLRQDVERIKRDAALYRHEKVAQLDANNDAAAADIASAEAHRVYARQQLDRAHDLVARGFATRTSLDKAEQDLRDATATRAAAEARARADAVESRAAGRGLLLTNGYSDVQYSTQRLSDLAVALSQLQGQRDAIAATLASAQHLSGAPGSTVTRQLRIPLQASVNGRVWARNAAAGETLREGDTIYSLADCSSFFAYFSVGRSTYSKLSVGRHVTFRALTDGARWPGTIVNLGVGDPASLRVTSQIPAPTGDGYLIGARINLPLADQQRCPVGTAGRVVL